MKQNLGIIGGLGPMATAYFMELIVKMTEAEADQEHLNMLVYHCPYIADRTRFILGESHKNPMDDLLNIGKKLVEQGVDKIAIPCVTAHYFQRELQEKLGIPVVDGITESLRYLRKSGVTTVGILATDGTVQAGLFSDEFEKEGVTCIYPKKASQQKIMELIYHQIKAGKKPGVSVLMEITEELKGKGAQVVLLGCTELSLIKKEWKPGAGILDITEVLARCCVKSYGRLKACYEELN